MPAEASCKINCFNLLIGALCSSAYPFQCGSYRSFRKLELPDILLGQK